MRKREGFTLVELLVVMAIIAILAAIVVPNVQRYIVRARVTRAIAEINGMELALTAMLTDAGRSNLNQLFEPGMLSNHFGVAPTTNEAQWATFMTNNFNAVTDLYSGLVYDLLRYGRNVLLPDSGAMPNFAAYVKKDILVKLGTNYMDIGLDPWGNQYRIFPGPWKFANNVGGTGRAPIPFRKFSVETGSGSSSAGARSDNFVLRDLTRNVDRLGDFFLDIITDIETWPDRVGFPADPGKSAFIWSFGDNGVSSQMIYTATYDAANPINWYNAADAASLGGGDDINNWDTGSSWQRFYN